MAIKIDLRVPPCKPVPEVTAFVKECEDAGFNGVGMIYPKRKFYWRIFYETSNFTERL